MKWYGDTPARRATAATGASTSHSRRSRARASRRRVSSSSRTPGSIAGDPGSHRQVLLHEIVGELVHRAGGDDRAALHQEEALGDPAREGELLLDEQDRELLLLVEAPDHRPDLVHDVR